MRHPRYLLISILTVGACAGPNWHPLTVPTPAPLESKTIIEFRVKEALVRLHGVTFSKDSVSGIPWLEHLSCDTCRVVYALADVSGVRTGNPGAGAWLIAGPMLVAYSVLTIGSFIYYMGMRGN